MLEKKKKRPSEDPGNTLRSGGGFVGIPTLGWAFSAVERGNREFLPLIILVETIPEA